MRASSTPAPTASMVPAPSTPSTNGNRRSISRLAVRRPQIGVVERRGGERAPAPGPGPGSGSGEVVEAGADGAVGGRDGDRAHGPEPYRQAVSFRCLAWRDTAASGRSDVRPARYCPAPPMLATKTQFVCQECGAAQPKWHGRCPACSAWGSMVEEVSRPTDRRGGAPTSPGEVRRPQPLADVEATRHDRLPTGIDEFDRVLGGGLVPGSLMLIGGDPGIGKSTLTTMALARLAARQPVLLVCGEESPAQVRMRAERIGGAGRIGVIAETDLDVVCQTLVQEQPGGRGDRLRADAVGERPVVGARLRGAGARGRRPAAARREGARHHGGAGRPRDEGRHGRRAARARAPGRRGAAVRGRPHRRPARAAGGEEPVRLHRRDRRVRDDGHRPRAGRRPVRAARPRRPRRARLGGGVRGRGHAAAAARGAGAGGAERARDAAPARHRRRPQPPGDDPGGAAAARRAAARLCRRVRERRGRRRRRTSPPPTSRSRSRSRRRSAACPPGRWSRSARSASPAGCGRAAGRAAAARGAAPRPHARARAGRHARRPRHQPAHGADRGRGDRRHAARRRPECRVPATSPARRPASGAGGAPAPLRPHRPAACGRRRSQPLAEAHRVLWYDARGFGESGRITEPYRAVRRRGGGARRGRRRPRRRWSARRWAAPPRSTWRSPAPTASRRWSRSASAPAAARPTRELRAGWDAVSAAYEAGDIERAIDLDVEMWIDRGPVFDQVRRLERGHLRARRRERPRARARARPACGRPPRRDPLPGAGRGRRPRPAVHGRGRAACWPRASPDGRLAVLPRRDATCRAWSGPTSSTAILLDFLAG